MEIFNSGGKEKIMETWELLKKELAVYEIELLEETGKVIYEGSEMTIGAAAFKIKKELEKETELFYESVENTLKLLYETQKESLLGIDETRIKLFLNSLGRFCDLFEMITSQKIHSIYLGKDLTEYGSKVIEALPDYLMSLDILYRVCSVKRYKIKLLRCARRGKNQTNKIKLKTAGGVNAPWGRMDLPLLERAFPYADIEEEMQGKRDDIKRQHRYRKGLENYNDPSGKVGEGHYWREYRNEAFLWTDRFSESPYVTLGSGTWR